MFGDASLTFREFAMSERLPLAVIHDAVLEFLRGRNDAVLFGAQAVNAYVGEPRMTQDVDLVSPRAADLAEELRSYLHKRFRIAVRVREVKGGTGYRIYQVRKPHNRHLVDIRSAAILPRAKRVKRVLVVTPPQLIANKVESMVARRRKPKGLQDRADLYRLLLAFPQLKQEEGPVADCLHTAQAGEDVMLAWKELVALDIQPEDEDEDF
jgi:hypothetical protein